MRFIVFSLAALLGACATSQANTTNAEAAAREECAARNRADDAACIREAMANIEAARRYDPEAERRAARAAAAAAHGSGGGGQRH